MTTDVKVEHPARWSQSVLDAIHDISERHHMEGPALDPFAGVDIDRLADAIAPVDVHGVELEPEWAATSGRTVVGNALDLPFERSTFSALVSSPTFGNRMADCHTPSPSDASKRITYRHKLNRMPTFGSSAVMQWGDAYRTFHGRALAEALRVLDSDALIVWNVANHIRLNVEQRVVEWHMNAWLQLGCTIVEVAHVPTPKMGFGANGDKRTDGERVLVLRAPVKPRGSML